MGEKDILYYRIKGGNGTFWLPVNKADAERVRRTVSQEKLQKAIRVLGEHPRELDKNHKERHSMIKEVKSKGSIVPIARLVRDLFFKKAERKLNLTEQEALEDLEKRLIMEWAVVLNIKPHEARMQLRDLLANNNL